MTLLKTADGVPATVFSDLDARLDVAEAAIATAASLRALTFPVESYGAVRGTNITTALLAAIAAAVAAGGGVVTMGPTGNATRYLFTGEINFPDRVNLRGSGARTTFLQATTAGSFLSFTGTGGGVSGEFHVTGADIADKNIYVGVGEQRTFLAITSERADVTLLLDGCQNMTFVGYKAQVCEYGIVLDSAAGGNTFVGHTEISSWTKQAVEFRQTGAPVGGFTHPSYNTFYSGMLEHSGTAGAIDGVVNDIAGGYLNQFVDVLLSASAANAACTLVKSRDPGGFADKRLRFTDCHFQGDVAGTYVTAFDLATSTNVELGGRCTFQSILRRFYMDDLARVKIENEPFCNAPGTYFVSNGGTAVASEVIRWDSELAEDLPGILTPSGGMWAFGAPVTLVAARGYFNRVKLNRTTVIASVAYAVTTFATNNDNVEVALFNSAGVRLVTSGSVASKLNTTTGVKTVALSYLAEPGVYYVGLLCPAVGGTAASLLGASAGNVLGLQMFGATAPKMLGCQQDSLSGGMPSTIAPAFASANLLSLALREA